MLARSRQLQGIFGLLKPFLHVQILICFVDVYQNHGVLWTDCLNTDENVLQHTLSGEGEGLYNFKCQHGPAECQGNMVHACATQVVQSPTTVLKYIKCMIGDNYSPLEAGQRCEYGILFLSYCCASREGFLNKVCEHGRDRLGGGGEVRGRKGGPRPPRKVRRHDAQSATESLLHSNDTGTDLSFICNLKPSKNECSV